MAPERGSLQGLLGASVPCDVTPGLAFPSPSPGGYPPHSGCHGPQTKPKPALAGLDSIQEWAFAAEHRGFAPVVLWY